MINTKLATSTRVVITDSNRFIIPHLLLIFIIGLLFLLLGLLAIVTSSLRGSLTVLIAKINIFKVFLLSSKGTIFYDQRDNIL